MSETATTITTTSMGTTTATAPAVYEFKATSDENKNPWEHNSLHYEKVREYAELYETLNYFIVREKIVMTNGKPTGIPVGKYDADFNKPWKFKQGENIGMRTGIFSNVSVLDIDNKPVKGFKFTSVEIFKAMLGFFSKTDEETKAFVKLAPRAITGGGGYHIFLPYFPMSRI